MRYGWLMDEIYVKLHRSILDSTVWQESKETKLVWITMLAMASPTGYVGAAIPGIASRAGVSTEEAEAAIERLLSPDPHSRSPDFGGRRIETADRGWLVLNYEKFRVGRDPEKRKQQNREAQRRLRLKLAAMRAEQPPIEAYEGGE